MRATGDWERDTARGVMKSATRSRLPAVAGSTALIVLLTSSVFAQDVPQPPGTETIPEVVTVSTHEDVFVKETLDAASDEKPKVADKKFWVVGAALTSAMLLDTWSTFDVISRCPGCREANPYVAPFVRRGPVVTVTAGLALDIGVMALSAKMKASKKPQIRNIWWLVPVALTAGHLISYHHNMTLGPR
jgi:hypothetical protein